MITPDRCVGIVDSVSSSEVKAYLLDEAPRNVAISNGVFSLFPRINGYLVIPNETGMLVGITTWIGYNHVKSENDVELPTGARMICLTILGHIEATLTGRKFERGVFSLPTVGDQILLPTEEDLNLINKIETNASFEIGKAPLLANQSVKLPINEFFGRHVAVLGNTGSGKSCTVAGLIRWSIEAAVGEINHSPNARYIILDPNGEYGAAFNDLEVEVDRYSIKSIEGSNQLRVPAWMWTSSEWGSLLQASDKIQKPILREALRDLRTSNDLPGDGLNPTILVNRWVSALMSSLRTSLSLQRYINKSERSNFGKELKEQVGSLKMISDRLDDQLLKNKISNFVNNAEIIRTKHYGNFKGNDFYNPFEAGELEDMISQLQNIKDSIEIEDELITSISEDDPIEFDVKDLASYIDSIAQNNSSSQYVDFMTVRIRSMLANAILSPVIGDNPKISLLDWINSFLGNGKEHKGRICIIDLSLLPTNIVHLIVATISRLIFEALQRYRKTNKKVLPTILVMEEAHTFIHRISENENSYTSQQCTKVFERIAREGRKYGLGLIVSSQRPAELSPTVLSQCNSFILHRIVNDRDQEMVRRLVPDNLGNMLNELPVLPTQSAIILGSAVSVPVMVEMRSLNAEQRPRSETPDFWNIWTSNSDEEVDWKPIVDEWQKRNYQ